MITFDNPLRITLHKFSVSDNQDIKSETIAILKTYAIDVLSNLTFDWIDGGTVLGDCDGTVCSSFYFNSIQSGLSDLTFPPISLEHFNQVPENITLSPVLHSGYCQFLNFYTDTSGRTVDQGVLSSFRIINYKVYILILILVIIASVIHVIRATKRFDQCWIVRSLRGITGFIFLATCWLSVYCIFQLLAIQFITNYSIFIRESPIDTLSDLSNRVDDEVSVIKGLHCYNKAIQSGIKADRFHVIDFATETVPIYLRSRISCRKIVLFESTFYSGAVIRIFCNMMINIHKTLNFYIHGSTEQHFNTFQVIAVNSKIDLRKKRWIRRSLYSCGENGFCLEAFERSVKSVLEKKDYQANSQCDEYEQDKGQFNDGYRPIKINNIFDLLCLFELLLGLSSIVFVFESYKVYLKAKFNDSQNRVKKMKIHHSFK